MKLNAVHRLLGHKIDEVWQPGVRGYHNGAGCILMAKDTGRFNLQYRAKGSTEPLTWGSWGGSMDGNEEPPDALRRELFEEAGYNGPMRAVILMVSRDPERSFVYHNYLGVVPNEFNLVTNDESAGHRWFHWHDMPKPLHFGIENLLKDQRSMDTISHYRKQYDPHYEN